MYRANKFPKPNEVQQPPNYQNIVQNRPKSQSQPQPLPLPPSPSDVNLKVNSQPSINYKPLNHLIPSYQLPQIIMIMNNIYRNKRFNQCSRTYVSAPSAPKTFGQIKT